MLVTPNGGTASSKTENNHIPMPLADVSNTEWRKAVQKKLGVTVDATC